LPRDLLQLKTMSESTNKVVVHVSEGMLGMRLDLALVDLVDGYSRMELQRLIRAGAVRLDGDVVERPGIRLEERSRVEIDFALPPQVEEDASPAPAVELPVIFEDAHLIVVEKPAGLLTHAAARNAATAGEASVAELAAARFGPMPSLYGEERPGIVHRLDRDTSGLLVLGRTLEALGALKRAFQAREIEKTYTAIVRGTPRFDSEWIEKPLGRNRAHRDRISILPEGVGREARTYYEVRERFEGHALLAVFPKTGRTHQVRVHLASIGMPLLGEKLYLPRNLRSARPTPSAPKIVRHALHAQILAFAHPITGEHVRFESPLPPDMAAALETLRASRGGS
jgi:23S rRNA pseudouridine1911/1915/1917 synthase